MPERGIDPPSDCPRCGARRERFMTDIGMVDACPACGAYELPFREEDEQ